VWLVLLKRKGGGRTLATTLQALPQGSRLIPRGAESYAHRKMDKGPVVVLLNGALRLEDNALLTDSGPRVIAVAVEPHDDSSRPWMSGFFDAIDQGLARHGSGILVVPEASAQEQIEVRQSPSSARSRRACPPPGNPGLPMVLVRRRCPRLSGCRV